MIRREELGSYLTCVAAELAGTIRKELQTDYARKTLDSLTLVLERLIAENGPGVAAAEAAAPKWVSLEAGFPKAAVGSDLPAPQGADGTPLERLEAIAARLQAPFSEPAALDRFVAALRSGDAAATGWLTDGAQALNGLLQQLQDNLQPTKPRQGAATVADDPEGLRQRLEAYLRGRFPELPEGCVTSLKIATGGQIKRTAIFRLADNPVLPNRLVLRQDMPFNFTGTVVTDEYEVLKRVGGLDVSAPRVLFVEPDAEKLGGQFLVMEEVPDAVGAGAYFPEERAYLGHTMGPELGREIAAVLGRLHGRTRQDDAAASREARVQRDAALVKWRAEWGALKKPAFSLVSELGAAWMLANPLPDNRPRTLTHGDVGAHNIMTRDGHLAALLDWELSVVGDPTEDIAQAKMMLLGDIIPWDEFVEAYVAAGGPPEACDPHAVAYYSIWTYLKHGVMNTQLSEWFASGARDDAPAASVAGHFVERLLLYQARALAEAVTIPRSPTPQEQAP